MRTQKRSQKLSKIQLSKSDLIHVGSILGPHGIKGALRVKSFCEIPTNLATYGPLQTQTGQTLTPISAQPGPKGTIRLTVKEITDRTQAEALAKTQLHLPKTAIPLAKGETLYADLINQPVIYQNQEIGTLINIFSNGAQDILEIKTPEKTILIPLLKDYVEIQNNKLHLTPAAEDFFNL